MTFADLVARASMLSAPLDEADLAPLRARLFGRLRSSGWAPSGDTRGTPGAAESDAVVLAAFVGGDAAAFDILFERHAARLNGYARRWLQSAEAADAVQEAFLVLFEKASDLLDRDDINVGGYLFGTLRHKVLKARNPRETPVAEAGEKELSGDDDAYTTLCRREDAGRLAEMLVGTCSPLEQHVVMLDVEDRSDAEIASALEISLVHVRVTRHRAHKKLRGALREEAR